jgi:hypothetical protein
MWEGEQARVLGETERILGEQAYEDVLATVIINKVEMHENKDTGSIRASSKIISLPAEKEFFWSFSGLQFYSFYICRCEKLSIFSFWLFLEIGTEELGQEKSVKSKGLFKVLMVSCCIARMRPY